MGGVDKSLQFRGTAVRILRSEGKDTVVAPVSRAGELGDRHQFYSRNSQRDQFVQMANQRRESAFSRVSSYMHFVKDTALKWNPGPATVGPFEGVQVHQLRRAVN